MLQLNKKQNQMDRYIIRQSVKQDNLYQRCKTDIYQQEDTWQCFCEQRALTQFFSQLTELFVCGNENQYK